MAIKMRRGNYADFDPTKMVAGEFAVCLDNGYVYMTLSPGNVIRLGTYDTIAEIVAQAQAYAESAGQSASSADDSAEDSEAWAVGTIDGVAVSSSDPRYHNNSKYYANESETYYNYVHEAVETHDPNFTIDWTTGELLYSGGYFTFWVDTDGFLKWGVENP